MADPRYDTLNFKIPKESEDYPECSEFVVNSVEAIIENAIRNKKNRIIINTNLRFGIPMENVNKIAGPFVEAWAYETFYELMEDTNNTYRLINVETKERLNMADVILQFKRERKHQTSVTVLIPMKVIGNSDWIPVTGSEVKLIVFGAKRRWRSYGA